MHFQTLMYALDYELYADVQRQRTTVDTTQVSPPARDGPPLAEQLEARIAEDKAVGTSVRRTEYDPNT
jgi:hypothetical protein